MRFFIYRFRRDPLSWRKLQKRLTKLHGRVNKSIEEVYKLEKDIERKILFLADLISIDSNEIEIDAKDEKIYMGVFDAELKRRPLLLGVKVKRNQVLLRLECDDEYCDFYDYCTLKFADKFQILSLLDHYLNDKKNKK